MGLSRIEVITGMSKFSSLKAALSKAGVRGMTVMQVLGCGVEKGTREYEVDELEEMELLPKQQINIVVETERVDSIVEIIKEQLYTGHIGDGRFLSINWIMSSAFALVMREKRHCKGLCNREAFLWKKKKLGLKSVISVSVGLVIATSCLVSLGQGAGTIGVTFIFAMVIACLFNMTTIASLSELNALMPNTTGGLAQYTLACLGPFPTMISMVGGYLFCNVLSSGVEASIFAYAMGEIFHLPIPNFFLYRAGDGNSFDCKLKRCRYVCQDSGCRCLPDGRFYGDYGCHRYAGAWHWEKDKPADGSFRRLENDCFHDRSCILAVYRRRICDPDFQRCQKCETECTAWNVSGTWVNLYRAVYSGIWISQLYTLGRTGRFSGTAFAIRRKSPRQCGKDLDGFCGGTGAHQFPEFCHQRSGKYLSGNGKNEYDAAVF